MAGIRQNITEIWNRISLMQRVVLVAVGLGCVGGAVMLIAWARKPEMALLYSRLSPKDASRVVEKIRDADTAYELTDGGTTIYVPRDEVYSLRLSLANASLPTGGQAGYEILDKQEFGASPFQLEVGYVRAVEGELAKSIQLIEGVSSARVHIVRPRAKIFAESEKGASATVMVQMGGSRRLTPANVAAVVHMVAGGVEDLSPDRVVVVDASGTLYTGEQGDEKMRRPMRLYDYKAQLEGELKRKAESLLALALGPNRAKVEVCLVLERSELEEKKRAYDEKKPVPAREEIIEKQTTGTDGKRGDKESNTTIEYVPPGETVTTRRDVPGEIVSKTVSAVVDLSPPPVKDGAEAGKMPTLADCEEIIKNAVGGLAEKDKLTVKEATIPQPDTAAALEGQDGGMFSKDFLLEVAKRSSLGLLVIGALLALRMLGGGKKRKSVESVSAGALPGGGSENLLPVSDSGEVDPEALRANITRALQQNPEEVKRLFLSWVESEKGA